MYHGDREHNSVLTSRNLSASENKNISANFVYCTHYIIFCMTFRYSILIHKRMKLKRMGKFNYLSPTVY